MSVRGQYGAKVDLIQFVSLPVFVLKECIIYCGVNYIDTTFKAATEQLSEIANLY